jgi:hypothetical protein
MYSNYFYMTKCSFPSLCQIVRHWNSTVSLFTWCWIPKEEYPSGTSDTGACRRRLLPPTSTHLHTLCRCHTTVGALGLERILRQTLNLRVLEVDTIQDVLESLFYHSRLTMGLDHVKSILTHLKCRFKVDPDEKIAEFTKDLNDRLAGTLGSLHGFHASTHLEVLLHILFGIENSLEGIFYPLFAVLPSNLETLIITDDLYMFNEFQGYFNDEDAMSIFRTYLENDWKEATRQLKEFVYGLRENGEFTCDYWSQREIRDDLRGLCKAQGVVGEILWK